MDNIEYFIHPLIKEMLEQQRMILEMHKELLKEIAKPLLVYHKKEESK